jgi:hypothetical protein
MKEPLVVKAKVPTKGTGNIKFDPVFEKSEAVCLVGASDYGAEEMKFKAKGGFWVIAADGAMGEKKGDILRFTTEWKRKIADSSGLIGSVASIGGVFDLQISLVDCMKVKQKPELVKILESNLAQELTEEMMIIVERPIRDTAI